MNVLTKEEIIRMAKALISIDFKRLGQIKSYEDCKDFLILELAPEKNEIFCVIFLDAAHKIIAFEKITHGSINSAPVYFREITKRALVHNAVAIICVHNHPSGELKASAGDIEITKKLSKFLSQIEIKLLDHVIVAGIEAKSLIDEVI